MNKLGIILVLIAMACEVLNTELFYGANWAFLILGALLALTDTFSRLSYPLQKRIK